MKKRGTKQEVYDGLAEKTNGGLKKEDLILNKRGAIVSKKRSEQGAKQFKNIEHFAKNKSKNKSEIKADAKEAKESIDKIADEKIEKGGGLDLKPEAIQEEKNVIEAEPAPVQEVKPAVQSLAPPASANAANAAIAEEAAPKQRGRKPKEVKKIEPLNFGKQLN